MEIKAKPLIDPPELQIRRSYRFPAVSCNWRIRMRCNGRVLQYDYSAQILGKMQSFSSLFDQDVSFLVLDVECN